MKMGGEGGGEECEMGMDGKEMSGRKNEEEERREGRGGR